MTRPLALCLVALLGCGSTAQTSPPADAPAPADASLGACPEGQVDLDFSFPDGRRVRECLDFHGTLISAGCRRIGFGGTTTVTTLDDPAVFPRPPLSRFALSNAADLGDARGTVTMPFSMIFTLDRAGECADGRRFCQYVAVGNDPRYTCPVEAVLPAPGVAVVSYRLVAPCSVPLIDPASGAVVEGAGALTLHRMTFRGPLVAHDLGIAVTDDGGYVYCDAAP